MEKTTAPGMGLMMCLAVLALIVTVACSKADGTGEATAPQPVETGRTATVTADRNELVLNDTVYPLQSNAYLPPSNRYSLMGFCPEGEALYLFTAEVLPAFIGKSFDLTDAAPDGSYEFAVSGVGVPDFSLSNVGGVFYGALRDDVHDGSTVFASGTVSATLDRGALEYKVDGVLIDGTTVSIYFYVPEDEIDRSGYCGESHESGL